MDVHFDIAYSETHHLRNAFEQIVPVLFLGVEEAVLRTLPAASLGASSAMRGHRSRHLATRLSAGATDWARPNGS